MFKIGQRVVVLRAHYGGSNDEGTVIKKCSQREYKGMWWIDLGYTQLPVEPERLVDSVEYWKEYIDKQRQ